MEVGARPATAADLPRLSELMTQAVEELRPGRGGDLFARREARADPSPGALAALLGGGAAVFVGSIDATPIGVATVHAEDLRGGGRLAVVDEIYVEPGARGVGVGEALMDAVIAWAESQGCEGVDAMVLPGDRATKNFFETFGLTARAIVVHRRLAADG